MSKSQKKKVRQTANGKLNPEEVQHLRRCGFTITKSSSKRLTKRPLRRFAAWWETTPVEKFLEDVVFLLKNAALLDIINLAAGITIIISLGTWLATEKQRRDAEIYQAWQVITTAYNQSGSGGRKEALEFLNSEPRRNPWFWLKWEAQSLAGLAAQKAYLANIQLPEAALDSANFQQTNLWGANLQRAYLVRANLQQANLMRANLQQADLRWANLQQADLWKANLQQAQLQNANLQGTILWDANLQQANLERTNYLTPEQIQSACFWEQAIYKSVWNNEKNAWVASEPDNTNFIEELKKGTASEPQKKPDCSLWSK